MAYKEVTKLIKQIKYEGGVVTKVPNGHWRVFNPATGQAIQISSSPSDNRSMRYSLAKVRRIGLLQRQKSKEAATNE
jgi:hypothetical protein